MIERSSHRRVAANAIGSAIHMTAALFSGLVMYALIMRALGEERVGAWLAMMTLGMIAVIGDLGLPDAMIRRAAVLRANSSWDTLRDTLETVVITVGASIACVFSVILLLVHLGLNIIDPSSPHVAEAYGILPWIGVIVLLQRIGEVYGATLDGMQAFLPRGLVSVVGYATGLALAFLLVEERGLEGLAIALTVQGAVIYLGYAALLHGKVVGGIRILPRIWRRRHLTAILGYGLSVQGMVFSFLSLEIISKLLLARMGMLAAVAYMELAFRVGRGSRNLIVAGNRVLIPMIAGDEAGGDHTAKIRAFNISFELLTTISIPLFALALGTTGLWSIVFMDRWEPDFFPGFLMVMVGWLAYCLADPAFNFALGTGRLRSALAAHLGMVALQCVLCWPLLSLLGAQGVFLATGLSMLLGSFALAVTTQTSERIPRSRKQSIHLLTLAVTFAAFVVASLLISSALRERMQVAGWVGMIAALWLIVTFGTIRLLPVWRTLTRTVQSLFGAGTIEADRKTWRFRGS